MNEQTQARKVEHLRIIESDAEVDRQQHYFDAIRLTHRALPECSLADIDAAVTFMGKRLDFPLLISCMTGGDHDALRTLNRRLAEAAELSGVAMGVGSQRVMFTHPAARDSFALRQWAPDALLWANLGAVQLNNGFTPAMCREAVETVGADALVLHLNPLQEAIQPEGDTDFRGLVDRIAAVVDALSVPVVVKEVGAGISRADADLLLRAGVRYLDVAGSGGLSWSRVEHHRRVEMDGRSFGLLFQDWGLPTPMALQALRPLLGDVTLIASGGIRSGIDMAKAIILGAKLCGLASPFLKPAQQSAEAVVSRIEELKQELVTTMFLLGVSSVNDLWNNTKLMVAHSVD